MELLIGPRFKELLDILRTQT